MKSIVVMIVLPLAAFACVQWELGKNKRLLYHAVIGDDHDSLYQMRDIDIKPLACMSKEMNSTLGIDGVPEFSQQEVNTLCNIPDFCFKNRAPKIYEIPDTEPWITSAEV